MTKDSKKPFKYKAFILAYDFPNAFAIPGGVVLITRGLIDNLESEAELSSILAHEIGHIELNHCFDLVKFELLERKMQSESVGKLVDLTINIMLTPAFSKTIENEAGLWWKLNQNKKRYIGKKNLINKINYYDKDYNNEEWIKK